jgi:hypothetical protein
MARVKRKEKFRVGQVVIVRRNETRIVKIAALGYDNHWSPPRWNGGYFDTLGDWHDETELRALTPREAGKGKG